VFIITNLCVMCTTCVYFISNLFVMCAGEECVGLLRSLGRTAEAESVEKIIELLRSQLPQ
jgi:hypothetical protein